MLPFAFENPKPDRIVGQVGDRVIGFASMVRLGEVVNAAIDHLQRNRCKRLVQSFGYGVGQVNQDGIQQPSRPQLKLDAILRTRSRPGPATV